MSNKNDLSALDQLYPEVRKWVAQKKWSSLREIQAKAIPLILRHDCDLVIAASTAGGKTEAAYLPICSYLLAHPAEGIRAISVSPLKALINDQFDRLELLCDPLGIPMTRWHGDVDSGPKKRLMQKPQGLLLITPESLEALLVLNGSRIADWFAGLDFLIVDELHAFFNTERGRQLQSLLCRIEKARGRKITRIGLSATLGDMNLAKAFIRPPHGHGVETITGQGGEREVKLQVRGYEISAARDRGKVKSPGGKMRTESDQAIAQHLFKILRGHDNLIFSNTRSRVERFSELLRTLSSEEDVPNEFFPHHGSLDKAHRESMEAALKDRTLPASMVCTATLEMGIDIGNVRTVAQVGCPPSVAALNQRLGRSGRSDEEPARLRIYIQEQQPTEQTPLHERMHPDLVQTVAMVELLLARWCEPPLPQALHLSTLVQQLLALMAQMNGVKALEAFEILCKQGPFRSVTEKQFIQLLRHLGSIDWVVQDQEGFLLLGEHGEREVNQYRFYSAFGADRDYRVVHEGRTLGNLPASVNISQGKSVVFGGRSWRILTVDRKQGEIVVVPGSGGHLPVFSGKAAQVHTRVRQAMLALYRSDQSPAYLDENGQRLLESARSAFKEHRLEQHYYFDEAVEKLWLFPWTGDRALQGLLLQLAAAGLDIRSERFCLIVKRSTPKAVKQVVEKLVDQGPARGRRLARSVKDKVIEKYDSLLPEALLESDYVKKYLDPEESFQALQRFKEVL